MALPESDTVLPVTRVRTSEVRETLHVELRGEGEGAPAAFAPIVDISVDLEPAAVMGVTEMEKTIKWLSAERLTKLIPVFEENEAVLEEITDLSEEEFEEFINELPHSILLKKRLRKAVAKLREEIDQKESSEEQMDEAKVEDSSASPKKASAPLGAVKAMRVVHKVDVATATPKIPSEGCETTATKLETRTKPVALTAVASMKSTSETCFGTEHRVEESTAFLFDTSISEGSTHPEYFKVSTDRKTVTLTKEGGGQILLTPAISKGTHSLEFCIEEITGVICIGVVNDCRKLVMKLNGCAFDSNGSVYTNYQDPVVSRRYGRWKKDDRIILIADLNSAKLTIKTRIGQYTVDIQSLGTPLWFAVLTFAIGNSLSVAKTVGELHFADKTTTESSVSCANCCIV